MTLEPSHQQVPAPNDATVDVVVIGGGAAGLAAALQLGRVRRSVVVIDAGAPRNAPAAHLHSYLGRDGLPPGELLADGRAEVEHYGGTIRAGAVVAVTGDAVDGFTVTLADGSRVTGRRLIVATGITDDLPEIPGLTEGWGRDVIHCPFCHGWEVRDQRLVVIDSAGLGAHQAMLFRQLSATVTLVVHEGDGPSEEAERDLDVLGIPVVTTPVSEVARTADGPVAGVRLIDGTMLPADAVVVGAPFHPNLTGLDGIGLTTIDHPSGLGRTVAVDANGATDVAGVYAVGNLTDPSQQLLQAAAQGSRTAGLLTFELVHDDVARSARSRDDAAGWDERYASRGAAMWSGAPNGSLVQELDGVIPGRALDIGCGEGGDAIWLAQRGWHVTAVDISAVAVERSRMAGAAAGVAVEWQCLDVLQTPPPAGSFDLVSMQYPALLVSAGRAAVARVLDAVAPGGTLLVVGHDLLQHHHAEPEHGHDHSEQDAGGRDFDPADYVDIDAVAALLPAGFDVEMHEVRSRPNPPQGAHHVDDVVLRARRRC